MLARDRKDKNDVCFFSLLILGRALLLRVIIQGLAVWQLSSINEQSGVACKLLPLVEICKTKHKSLVRTNHYITPGIILHDFISAPGEWIIIQHELILSGQSNCNQRLTLWRDSTRKVSVVLWGWGANQHPAPERGSWKMPHLASQLREARGGPL